MADRRTFIAGIASIVSVLAAVGSGPAHADERLVVPADPTWKTECGACHVAYPPQLLPAASWRAILGGLDRHFGADASLDATTTARIASFLEQHAGRDRGATASHRITETAWFRREHREVPAAAWKHTAVKSPANCSACHPGAERGNYDEHGVRLPR